MSDLIKKSDAIETLNAVDVYGDGIGFEVLSHAIRDVSLLPTVEAVPVSFLLKLQEKAVNDEASEIINEIIARWDEKGKKND